MPEQTTNAVEPGDVSSTLPEFGRTADVTRLFGLKRGSLYALHDEGKVRSALLRPKGSRKGVRLWHLASIRDLIISTMATPGGQQ